MRHNNRYIVTLLSTIFLFATYQPARADYTSLIGPDVCGDINLNSTVDVLDSLFAADVAVFGLVGEYLPAIATFISGGGVPTLDRALASCINGDTNSNGVVNILDSLFMARVAAGLQLPSSGNCPNVDVCTTFNGEACMNMYGYSVAAVQGAFCQPNTEPPCSSQCQPIDPNNWTQFLTGLAQSFSIIGSGSGCSAGPQSAPLLPDQCFVGTIGSSGALFSDLSDQRPGSIPDSCFTYGGCVNAVINSTVRALAPGDPAPVFSCWYSDDGHPIDFVFCRQP